MMSIETESKFLKNRVKKVNINFTDLTYQVKVPGEKKKKKILDGISGTFRAGQLSAIMGPSGSGKSSLLNILTGFSKEGVTGKIDFDEDGKSCKLCCYIMQDDHFYAWFTVEETMMLAATLKISNNSMSIKEKQLLIDHLMDILRLSQAKRTKCSNLSGGQKKRLSIALELIDNPPVFFLDEPTTGLDSSSCFDTIQLLQLLASEGRTIVCTIHQPSSFIYQLFDQIFVISQGRCTYAGTPCNTMAFLHSIGLQCPAYHNPADFLLECVSGEYGDHNYTMAEAAKDQQWLRDHKNENSCLNEAQRIKMQEIDRTGGLSRLSIVRPCERATHIYPPPEWVRLWLLIGRCHVQFFRDWTVTYLKLAIHICCAFTIALFFGDSGSNASKQVSNLGSFIIHCVYLWYTTMMPGVLRFPQEINIIKKETFNNWYKLRTYYLATLITSTPVHIMFSFAYTTIVYFMTDQPFEIERFVKFVLTAVVVTICADGLGILLGTVLNPVNGTFVGAILTCFMLIFSGFLILLTHMSQFMQIVSHFSPIRYGLECMILSIYSNNRENTVCPSNVIYCHFKNATTILKTFGMENSNFGVNILIILFQIAIFKGVAYFTLKRKLAQ